MEPPLNKEQFEKVFVFLRARRAEEDRLEDALSKMSSCGGVLFCTKYESFIIDLLRQVFKDEEEDMIGYWYYELEAGKKWNHGSLLDENNNFIDISSPRKLWEYLVETHFS